MGNENQISFLIPALTFIEFNFDDKSAWIKLNLVWVFSCKAQKTTHLHHQLFLSFALFTQKFSTQNREPNVIIHYVKHQRVIIKIKIELRWCDFKIYNVTTQLTSEVFVRRRLDPLQKLREIHPMEARCFDLSASFC